MPSPYDVTARFTLAQTIAREAGAIALGYFKDRQNLTIDTKLNGQDVVSIADKEVELFLRRRIAAEFPEDGILGEEFGLQSGTSGFLWVMDPIDGTSPFVNGIPAWCVSIAVMQAEATVVGVIFAPTTGELYAARRGEGATLNGTRLLLPDDVTLQTGVMGLGANHRVPARQIADFVERLLGAGGMFIRNGSGALMLAYVAAGRLAAYYEPHMNAWDCFAGLLMIEEAGGWIHDPAGWPGIEAGGPVIAGSGGTRTELLALVVA